MNKHERYHNGQNITKFNNSMHLDIKMDLIASHVRNLSVLS